MTVADTSAFADEPKQFLNPDHATSAAFDGAGAFSDINHDGQSSLPKTALLLIGSRLSALILSQKVARAITEVGTGHSPEWNNSFGKS